MSDDHELPGPDELITIADAAALCGLTPGTLRVLAASGRLRVQKVTPRLNMTTRRWLHEYLQERGTGYQGPPPKPLPPNYQPPGPGRPRTPRPRPMQTPPTEEDRQP